MGFCGFIALVMCAVATALMFSIVTGAIKKSK